MRVTGAGGGALTTRSVGTDGAAGAAGDWLPAAIAGWSGGGANVGIGGRLSAVTDDREAGAVTEDWGWAVIGLTPA